MDADPKTHAHVVLGKADGTAHSGHLIEATVCPMLEVVLTELPHHRRRKRDPATGLTLIQPTSESCVPASPNQSKTQKS